MLEILKEKNKRKIVIIKLGAFYIATEEDAVFLHKKIDLKCNCFKNNICKMLEEILYINKSKIDERNTILNRIDSKLNYQRILLRIMKENRWIDEKKFLVCIEKIHEIGKIVGGLIRYYGKNNKK